ncbi:hypothetical protein ACMD2_24401, partial [Ananas comosus]
PSPLVPRTPLQEKKNDVEAILDD